MSNAVIKVENCYSWLSTNDEKISKTLWKALRFRAKNYYHHPAFKSKVWDGYDEYYKLTSGRFLTGLLPEVEAALHHLGCQYTLDDYRGNTDFKIKHVDKDFLHQWDIKFTLHDYQVDHVNEFIKYKRALMLAPTASGKTIPTIAILKCLKPNTPVLVLANKKSLADQNYKELIKWKFENVGRLYDKFEDPNIITCATVQSAHKIIKLLPKIKVLVVDESCMI